MSKEGIDMEINSEPKIGPGMSGKMKIPIIIPINKLFHINISCIYTDD